MTTRIRIQTVTCPVCRKEREVTGNTAHIYERLCRHCNGKRSARRPKAQLVTETSKRPDLGIVQAPCWAGMAHHWVIPHGVGSEYCLHKCGQKMASERWQEAEPKVQGWVEPHPYVAAWGLKPATAVNTW